MLLTVSITFTFQLEEFVYRNKYCCADPIYWYPYGNSSVGCNNKINESSLFQLVTRQKQLKLPVNAIACWRVRVYLSSRLGELVFPAGIKHAAAINRRQRGKRSHLQLLTSISKSSSVSNCAALLRRMGLTSQLPAPRSANAYPLSRRISLKFKLLLIVFLRMPSNGNRILFFPRLKKGFAVFDSCFSFLSKNITTRYDQSGTASWQLNWAMIRQARVASATCRFQRLSAITRKWNGLTYAR